MLLFFQVYEFEILCPTGINLIVIVQDQGKQKISISKNKWCSSFLEGAKVLTFCKKKA
jgi:hypothetical protein